MISSILVDLMPWALGIVAALAGLLGYGRTKKAEGREQTYIEVLKDRHDREEKGREAAADLRGADRDELVDRMRRNDGQW